MKVKRSQFIKIVTPITILIQSLILILVCNVAEAGAITPFVRSIDGVKVLDLGAANSCQEIYKSTSVNYFPTKMGNANSSSKVAREIINYNIKNLFNASHMKSVKRTAQTVSEGLATNYKSEDGHSFSLKFKALNAKTVMSYKGLVNAKLEFKVDNQALNLEFSKDIANSTQLVFTHKDKSDERSDLLALRLSF